MYRDLFNFIEKRLKNISSSKTAFDVVRKVCKNQDFEILPMGCGNQKTDLPGFYRKVGDTCPSYCPFLNNGCYAQVGHTTIHQNKATNSKQAVLNSIVICSYISDKYFNNWSRMFVSGDVFIDNKVDVELLTKMKEVGKFLQQKLSKKIVAYGYTHSKDHSFLKELKECGLPLVASDYLGQGGCIVHPFDNFNELKQKVEGFKLVKCPAQLKAKLKCNGCSLCAKAFDKNICIVFDPHGSKKKLLPLKYFDFKGMQQGERKWKL